MYLKDDELIYDDDEISAIQCFGNSEEILITFGCLDSYVEGKRFFGDTPAKKLGINCIGIMAKGPHWYPAKNMDSVVNAIQNIIDKFKTRIVYGGSMGGYAALKYSRQLAATHVIALCPQWSLDKEECDGFDPGWQSDFRPYMKNMGVRNEDLSGHIYLFFDPFDKRDTFHAEKICSLRSGIRKVFVSFVKHDVTVTICGTECLRDIIHSCLSGNINKLHQISKKKSHKEKIFWNNFSDRYIESFPMSSVQIVKEDGMGNHNIKNQINKKNITKLTKILIEKGHDHEVGYLMRKLSENKISIGQKISIINIISKIENNNNFLKIKTYFSTYFYYDAIDDMCVHKKGDESSIPSYCLPVKLYIDGGQMYFSVFNNISEIFLGVSSDTHRLTASEKKSIFEIIDCPEGGFHLRNDGKYLCANLGYGISCNGINPNKWETFYIG